MNEGVDVNAKSLAESTALHQACVNEHEAFVQLLVDEGPELNVVDTKGRTPLS